MTPNINKYVLVMGQASLRSRHCLLFLYMYIWFLDVKEEMCFFLIYFQCYYTVGNNALRCGELWKKHNFSSTLTNFQERTIECVWYPFPKHGDVSFWGSKLKMCIVVTFWERSDLYRFIYEETWSSNLVKLLQYK